MSSERERFSRFEIVAMRWLFKCGWQIRPIRISVKFREPIRKLWRKGIVEIWWRNPPRDLPAAQGPFYALSPVGAKVAEKFFHRSKLHPAPRGISGAEQTQ